MNVILITSQEVGADSCVLLEDKRSDHIVKILKCKKGDVVRVGIVNGMLGSGIIREIEKQKPVCRVVIEVTTKIPPPQKLPVDLLLALPRPIMLKKILAQAASMGVGHIFLVNANRVEKSFFEASLLKDENYLKYLLDGIEQSVDTIIPSISLHNRFRPFIEDELPGMQPAYSSCLVAHPEASPVHTIDYEVLNGQVLIAVGPEGGWVDFEIEKFREQGFISVGLGERILRVDTAVVSLLAQVSLLKKCHSNF